MQALKRIFPSLASRISTRGFAQVYDVKIVKVGNSSNEEHPFGTEPEKTGEKGEMPERNVLSTPLHIHSTSPPTGYLRTGYCTTPQSDTGNHSIAGILTSQFLDFSASRGNDLRRAGLTSGCKWCLCASRWKEAFDARTSESDPKVPKVVLESTSERALETVRLEDLRAFAVGGGGERMVNGNGGGGGGMANGTGSHGGG